MCLGLPAAIKLEAPQPHRKEARPVWCVRVGMVWMWMVCELACVSMCIQSIRAQINTKIKNARGTRKPVSVPTSEADGDDDASAQLLC